MVRNKYIYNIYIIRYTLSLFYDINVFFIYDLFI